jgi:hypothetical protein
MNDTYGNVRDGRKLVTTAGTAVTLAATNTPCMKVEITALESNTDKVVVGGSTVIAALLSRRGVPLDPSQTLTLYVEDLLSVYLDAVVSGEGVSYAYYF